MTIQNGAHPSTSVRRPLVCRGVRGATTSSGNKPDEILAATRELLYVLIRTNSIHPDDVASVVFTTTADLDATYPALAARQLGWYDVALLCGHEMAVPDGLGHCIRVLIHWNTARTPREIHHVYLREAQSLRPDRTTLPPIPAEEIEAAVRHFDLSTLHSEPPIAMSLREPA
jgi:chorismate mutase